MEGGGGLRHLHHHPRRHATRWHSRGTSHWWHARRRHAWRWHTRRTHRRHARRRTGRWRARPHATHRWSARRRAPGGSPAVHLRLSRHALAAGHHLCCPWTANTTHRAGQPLWRIGGSKRNSSAGRLRSTRPPLRTRHGLAPIILRWRPLYRHGDNSLTANEHEAQRALLLTLLCRVGR